MMQTNGKLFTSGRFILVKLFGLYKAVTRQETACPVCSMKMPCDHALFPACPAAAQTVACLAGG